MVNDVITLSQGGITVILLFFIFGLGYYILKKDSLIKSLIEVNQQQIITMKAQEELLKQINQKVDTKEAMHDQRHLQIEKDIVEFKVTFKDMLNILQNLSTKRK